MSDSKATLRTVKRVQFGILAPDEIVSINKNDFIQIGNRISKICEIFRFLSSN